MADDSDATPAPEGENASGIPKSANPGTQPEPPYQIMRQYVKDLSFENPNAPVIFTKTLQPEARIEVDVQTNALGGRDVEVVMTVEAKAEFEGETAYVMELSYGAIVRVGQVPREALDGLLLVEVPRMLFPFVREKVCEATRSGGFSMLLMAPFDFLQLYRARLAARQAAEENADKPDETETA